MKLSQKQIENIIVNNKELLEKEYHVERLGLFGSVARGEETTASDVDVLVDFSKPIGFFKFIELEEFLSNQLGRKVDLVTRAALKPMIRDEILSETLYV